MNPLKCPKCPAKLNLPSHLTSGDAKCPRCGVVFSIEEQWEKLASALQAERLARLPSWDVGARILTYWEWDWFYPGTIEAIDEEEAIISFDDGDRASRHLLELLPIKIEEGNVVFARRDRRVLSYTPALVTSVSGERVRIVYSDGEEDELTASYLRFSRDKL
jgi:hypothetical protein